MPKALRQRLVVAGALSAAALGAAQRAQADQFVVADVTYTHSAQTTKDSHYRVNPTPETPANWASPVDYANGSVHVRLEVKTKPSATPTRYQICFEMKQNYCCTDQAPPYTTPGVYEWDTDVVDLWRPGPVDFTQGILRSALILKDTSNVKPAPENVGEETSKLYMPTDLSVRATVVSAGDTFMPPEDPQMPGGGSGGGGAGGQGGASSAGTGGAAGTTGGAATGTGGSPVMSPEPSAGTSSVLPTPTAGSAPVAPAAGTPGLASSGDEASCSVYAASGRNAAGVTALVGLALLGLQGRRRAARRLR